MCSVLVVGATRIFAPLVDALRRRGHAVTAVGRRAAPVAAPAGALAPVQALAADATSAAGVRRIAAAGPYGDAVLYGPAVIPSGDEVPADTLLAAVRGRAVLTLTSAAAGPADAGVLAAMADRRRSRRQDVVLLLGWTGPHARPRWHSAAEVSAAALSALDRGEDAVLGRLWPWSERPSAAQ